MRDHIAEFREKGAVVLGVSPDSVESHKKFKRKYTLNYPLLADPEHRIAELYDVWRQKSFMGKKYMGVERSTFIIDEAGMIAHAFRGVGAAEHADLVLAAL